MNRSSTQSEIFTADQGAREMINRILDCIQNFIVVTDADGYIMYLNKRYGKFLGVDSESQIGRHVTDVIENSRMHIVAKTGKPEIYKIGRLKGHNMVVHRVPMKKDGKVIATVGQVIFKDVRDLRELADKLSLLKSKVKFYEQELISLRSTRYTFDSIVGTSNPIISLKQEALQAALTDLPALISGESGTGKELFAQAIHHASARNIYPFIRINCASIPKDLLESELFGYEGGAFTGASSRGKPGKFELAHYGTIFLDEIGDLSLELQPKILRAIEEKEFERIGGSILIRTNFRIIAATNKNLEQMLDSGQFRHDLFYRLNVIPLPIPPLRERREDIIPTAHHLLHQIAQDSFLSEIKIDPKAEEALRNYTWPGNVRELLNVLERVVLSFEGDTIHLHDLPLRLYHNKKKPTGLPHCSLKVLHAITEKEAICQALVETNYNKARAADLLGVHRTVLYNKMKKYNLPLNKGNEVK